MEFLKITQETEEEFRRIAEKLFYEFAIQTKESKFRILELEFYWKSPSHNDESTYMRKYTNPSNGEWFFHYSGVDIALRNDSINGFGGILIRRIQDLKTKQIFNGPQVCAMKLFSGINAFSKDFTTRIIDYKFNDGNIEKTERIGLGKNPKTNNFNKYHYRFIIKNI